MGKHRNIYVGVQVSGSLNIDHMTLVWMGSDLPPISIMMVLKNYKDYKSSEYRKSIEFFGENKNLLVATMDLHEGSWLRRLREELIHAGCKDHSEFEWTPHVTLRTKDIDDPSLPSDIHIPSTITLGHPYISLTGQRIYA